MRILRVALAVLAAAAWPSAGAAFTCPARGGRPWREVASEHFAVSTDLESSEAADLVRELELMRAAVLAALFRTPPPTPGRLGVVAFRSQGDFEDFAPEGAGAYYTQLDGVEPLVVLPGSLMYRWREALAHELAHHFTAFVLLRQPAWLAEGLACYLEPLGSVALGAGTQVGTLPRGRRIRLRRDRVPLRDLLAWNGVLNGDTRDDRRHYDSAWFLVHYLVNERPRELRDLLGRLARAESPRAAWRAAFPAWDPDRPGGLDALEDALDSYARGGRYAYHAVDVHVSPRIAERPMEPAEVHAVRLRLWGLRPGGEDRAALESEVAEALVEDPGSPVALGVRSSLGQGDAVAAGREAVKLHPRDWRAWELLARAVWKGSAGECEAALGRAAELAPDEPAALNALAWRLVGDGRSGEALPPARRAVQLAPYSAAVLDTYAAATADLGMCAEALLAQHRALDVLREGVPEKARVPFRERLEAYERQCGSAPEAAPAAGAGAAARTPAR